MNTIIFALKMATTAAGAKRKREVLTLKAKKEILDRLERGVKPSSIMQEFNCGKSTISDIRKSKEKILGSLEWKQLQVQKGRHSKKKIMRTWRRLLTCGFSRNVLEGLPFLGQFFARRHCSSTSGFKMKTQPQILALRQVKDGWTILSADTEFNSYVSRVNDFQPIWTTSSFLLTSFMTS